jgi:hypothetical protein
MIQVKECLPGDDNDRDIILLTPEVKVLESGVEADVYSSALWPRKMEAEAYCPEVTRHI